MASQPPTDDSVVFRSRKKRKVYRQRVGEDEDGTAAEAISPHAQSLDELIAQAGEEADELSMAEILRSRKQRRMREGVAFKAVGSTIRNDEGQLVVHEEAVKGVGAVSRFATQTGYVADMNNKHMMAYVDSELEKRRPGALPKSFIASGHPSARPEEPQKKEAGVRTTGVEQGKLAEIDLGEEARLKNIALTKRSLAGEKEPPRPPSKIRYGPDGMPWRGPIKKKQRTEEDINRDKIVEDLMRENRLDIYEPPPPEPVGISDDQAADDRIAEAFRKDFLNAQSERQRQSKTKAAAAPTRDTTGKLIEELKGPKLGGSRSARAAMREALLKEAASKK